MENLLLVNNSMIFDCFIMTQINLFLLLFHLLILLIHPLLMIQTTNSALRLISSTPPQPHIIHHTHFLRHVSCYAPGPAAPTLWGLASFRTKTSGGWLSQNRRKYWILCIFRVQSRFTQTISTPYFEWSFQRAACRRPSSGVRGSRRGASSPYRAARESGRNARNPL